MSFRDLAGLPPQFEVKSDAEKWQGAFKAAQGAVREQGQVMSAALDNNRSLWETNKKLRAERLQILDACQRLEHERNALQAKLDAIPIDVQERAEVQRENEWLKKTNTELRDLLMRSMQPELNTEQLRERMEGLKTQAEELHATGMVPTWEEISRAEYAKDHPDDPEQKEFILPAHRP